MFIQKYRGLKRGLKRACAGLLITSVTCTATGVGTIFAEADESRYAKRLEIAGFEELSDEIANQYLPVGSTEADIEFPDSLVVTVRTIESGAKDADGTGTTRDKSRGSSGKVTIEGDDGDEGTGAGDSTDADTGSSEGTEADTGAAVEGDSADTEGEASGNSDSTAADSSSTGTSENVVIDGGDGSEYSASDDNGSAADNSGEVSGNVQDDSADTGAAVDASEAASSAEDAAVSSDADSSASDADAVSDTDACGPVADDGNAGEVQISDDNETQSGTGADNAADPDSSNSVSVEGAVGWIEKHLLNRTVKAAEVTGEDTETKPEDDNKTADDEKTSDGDVSSDQTDSGSDDGAVVDGDAAAEGGNDTVETDTGTSDDASPAVETDVSVPETANDNTDSTSDTQENTPEADVAANDGDNTGENTPSDEAVISGDEGTVEITDDGADSVEAETAEADSEIEIVEDDTEEDIIEDEEIVIEDAVIDEDDMRLTGIRWITADWSDALSTAEDDIGRNFFYVPDMSIYAVEVGEYVTLPQIRVTIVPADLEFVPFDAETEANGVRIHVTAPAGVFPAGSTLFVDPITDDAQTDYIETTIEEQLFDGSANDADNSGDDDGSRTVTIIHDDGTTEDVIVGVGTEGDGAADESIEESLSFDIMILNADGEEIEPDTSYGEVTVEFSELGTVAELEEENELKVFHFDEDEGLQELSVAVDSGIAVIETTGFSVYTVIKTVTKPTETKADDGVAPRILYGKIPNKYANGKYNGAYSAGNSETVDGETVYKGFCSITAYFESTKEPAYVSDDKENGTFQSVYYLTPGNSVSTPTEVKKTLYFLNASTGVMRQIDVSAWIRTVSKSGGEEFSIFSDRFDFTQNVKTGDYTYNGQEQDFLDTSGDHPLGQPTVVGKHQDSSRYYGKYYDLGTGKYDDFDAYLYWVHSAFEGYTYNVYTEGVIYKVHQESQQNYVWNNIRGSLPKGKEAGDYFMYCNTHIRVRLLNKGTSDIYADYDFEWNEPYTFTIKPLDISDDKMVEAKGVVVNPTYAYSTDLKSRIEANPPLTLTASDGGYTLQEGVDYELIVSDITEPKAGEDMKITITYKGINNCTGTREIAATVKGMEVTAFYDGKSGSDAENKTYNEKVTITMKSGNEKLYISDKSDGVFNESVDVYFGDDTGSKQTKTWYVKKSESSEEMPVSVAVTIPVIQGYQNVKTSYYEDSGATISKEVDYVFYDVAYLKLKSGNEDLEMSETKDGSPWNKTFTVNFGSNTGSKQTKTLYVRRQEGYPSVAVEVTIPVIKRMLNNSSSVFDTSKFEVSELTETLYIEKDGVTMESYLKDAYTIKDTDVTPDYTLVRGTDYNVTVDGLAVPEFSGDVNATLTFTGLGRYDGKVTKTVKIKGITLSDSTKNHPDITYQGDRENATKEGTEATYYAMVGISANGYGLAESMEKNGVTTFNENYIHYYEENVTDKKSTTKKLYFKRTSDGAISCANEVPIPIVKGPREDEYGEYLLYNGKTVKEDWYGDSVKLTVRDSSKYSFVKKGDKIYTIVNGNETVTVEYDETAKALVVTPPDPCNLSSYAVALKVYLKENSSTEDKVSVTSTVTLYFDTQSPTGSLTVSSIDDDDMLYATDVSDANRVDLTVSEPRDITVTGMDFLSGVSDASYYISDKVLSENDLKSVSWIKIDGNITGNTYLAIKDEALNKDGTWYVYARVRDNVGNVTYLGTDGVLLDMTAPADVKITAEREISAITGISVSATENGSGIDSYYLLYKEASDSAPKAAEIMGSGVSSKRGRFSDIDGLDSTEDYVLYAVAVDKLGNISTVAKLAMNAGKAPQGFTLSGERNGTMAKATASITGSDNGLKRYYLIYLEKDSAIPTAETIMTSDEVMISTTGRFTIEGLDAQTDYVAYAVAEDNADLVTDVAKLALPAGAAPKGFVLKAERDGTTATVTASVEETANGIEAYYLVYLTKGSAIPSAATIMNSEEVKKNSTGKFTIEGLDATTDYVAYAVAVDKAGNVTDVESAKLPAGAAPKGFALKGIRDLTTATVTASVEESANGIEGYYMIYQEDGETKPLENDILEKGQKSTTGKYSLSELDPQKSYVAYAVAKDNLDNVTDIESVKLSAGAAPTGLTLTGTRSGTSATAKAAAKEAENGIKSYYLQCLAKGAAAPSAATIQKNGTSSANGSFTINSLDRAKDYVLYAVAEDKAGFLSEVVTCELESAYAKMKILYNGEEKKDWYNEDVKLTAEGYQLAESEDGDYYDSYTFAGVGKFVKDLWFKSDTDGLSDKIEITVQIDKTAPTGTIKIASYSSSKFVTGDAMALATSSQPTITISGKDITGLSGEKKDTDVSGVSKIEYYLASQSFATTADLIKEAGDDGWSVYSSTAKPAVKLDGLTFVYARITDRAGNETYISTGGILQNSSAPVINSVTAERGSDQSAATVTVIAEDKTSGIDKYYLVWREADGDAPEADEVVSSGTSNKTGKFKVSGLDGSKAYTFYAVVTNTTGVRSAVATGKLAAGSAATGGLEAAANGIAGGRAGDTAGAAPATQGDRSGIANQEETASSIPEISRVPYISGATGDTPIGEPLTGGWERIADIVSTADPGTSMDVEMSGTSVIPDDVLNSLSGRDVTATFLMPDDVEWIISGTDMAGQGYSDMDLAVRIGSMNIPTELIKEIADVWPHTDFEIAHDGEFGYTATLRLPLGAANAGMYANRFYYNTEGKELVFSESVQVGADGYAAFTMSHASDYTVVLRDRPMVAGLGPGAGVSEADLTSVVQELAEVPVSRGINAFSAGRIWLFIIAIVSAMLCIAILAFPPVLPEKRRAR